MSEHAIRAFEATFVLPLSDSNCVVLKVKYPMPKEDFDLILETLNLWRPALCVGTENKLKTIDEHCGQPEGSFRKYVETQQEEERHRSANERKE